MVFITGSLPKEPGFYLGIRNSDNLVMKVYFTGGFWFDQVTDEEIAIDAWHPLNIVTGTKGVDYE